MSGALRIGILATLFGPFESMGKDGLRGVELAVSEFGGEVAGRHIELYPEGTIGTPDVAEAKAELLIEEKQVDFIVGPLSGNEGLGVRNFAVDHQDHVFLNGSSGAQELTIHGAPPNFFNFTLSGYSVDMNMTVEEGTNQLVGTNPKAIIEAFQRAVSGAITGRVPRFWDGKAAERIVLDLERVFGQVQPVAG